MKIYVRSSCLMFDAYTVETDDPEAVKRELEEHFECECVFEPGEEGVSDLEVLVCDDY